MPSRHLAYSIVDAFTQDVFAGNPAAVVVLDPAESAALSDTTRQLIAREFNFSETAFVTRTDNKDVFELRWFTPTREVAICGHATLGSAFVLFDEDDERERTITFKTFKGAGNLAVARKLGGLMEITFTAGVPTEAPAALVARVKEVIGTAFLDVDSGSSVVQEVAVGPSGPPYGDYMVIRIDGKVDLEHIKIKNPPFLDLTPFTVFCITNEAPQRLKAAGVDFVARVFDPYESIDEDPVTGSAYCLLTPYWAKRWGTAGKRLKAKQVSARGGDVQVLWDVERNVVKVLGHAAKSATGTLFIPEVA
ncbi:Diaminopimelate epimerase-like protein [Auriculariales sp. MPI-PUGE-AT-0066]|nr:Diaminopimelate epimerase-like protein [Auriculariales sp. MPI-PUGE-AT-0066]